MTTPKFITPAGKDDRNHAAKLRDAVKALAVSVIIFMSVTGAVHLFSMFSGYRLEIKNVQATVSPIGE